MCDFWVDPGDFERFFDFLCLPVKRNRRLHTTETAVDLKKPNNPPNPALIISILDKSEDRGPHYAFFPQKRWNVTFLPSEITHFCHQRPMYQIQQSRSSTIYDTTSFATRPDFHALPSDWTIVVMANSNNDHHTVFTIFDRRVPWSFWSFLKCEVWRPGHDILSFQFLRRIRFLKDICISG